MKKLGIFIAASALTLSLAACGSGASSTTTTAAAAETTAAASAETTAAAGAATGHRRQQALPAVPVPTARARPVPVAGRHWRYPRATGDA